MYDRKSDYALNKQDPDAIVCKSVTEVHIRLTRADFSNDKEFQQWKDWSDQDYYAAEKAGRTYHDLGLPLEDWAVPSVPSVEELLLGAANTTELDTARDTLALWIKNSLTEKQFRRLCLYYLEGRSEHEIARMEGVGQRRVSTSLTRGRKKLAKIFEESGGNRG